MKNFKYVFLASLTLVFNQTLPAQQMSLKEAISKALNQNTNLTKNLNNLNVTQEALKTAKAAILPTVGVSGGYSWKTTGGSGVSSSLSAKSSNWSMGIGGGVTLYDGLSTFENINQKQNNLNSAKSDLEKLKQDVILQTVNYYLTIVSCNKLLDFQKEDLKYNQALLEKINQMYAIKSAAVTDVFSQEAQTSNSELSYLQAENNYEKAKVTLLNFLALDVNADYTFIVDRSDVPDSTMIPAEFNNLFEIALSNRQDFKSANAKVKAAENILNSSKGANYPKITGNYDLGTSAGSVQDLFSQRTFSLGVNLSYPIFSQYAVESGIESAEIQFKNSKEDLSALERQVKTDVKNTFLDMETAGKQFEVAKKAQASAEQSWKAKKETYTLGAATYLDLQLSYNNYLQAKYTVISKEYGYLYSRFQMIAALGKLL